MTRALVNQLVEALEGSWDPTLGTAEREEGANEAIKAAREYLATEPSGERSELIQWLRGAHRVLGNENSKTIADMLETDAQQAKRVPMTMAEIASAWGACIDNRNRVFEIRTEFARAIEAHHGITQADKPTDLSAA